jgi:excisionase family DNA binding protein
MDNIPINRNKAENDNVGYSEAARLTGLARGTLYWMVFEHRIPHIRLGPRLVRFSVRELQSWLAEHAVPAQKGGGK